MSNFDRTSARSELVRWLKADVTPSAVALARVLSRCTAERPCQSRACPVCGGAFQASAVAATKRLVREAGKRGRKSQLTLISDVSCLEPEVLRVEACREVVASIEAALKEAGLPPCLGSLDISFNEDREGEVPEHWCVHGQLVGFDWVSENQKDALKKALGTSTLVKRPSKVDALDENIEGLEYVFKPERFRRVSFIETTDTRKPFRNTRPRALRPSQAIELALVEHELGFAGELLIHGIDRGAVWQRLEAEGWPRDGP